MAFHFFTGENSISVNQLPEMAFGAINNNGSIERYNLENKFTVGANSPVFATTKSLLIALEDASDSSLLNIATLPIDENYSAGFPVKFFIYKGISKSSLLDGNNKVKSEDGTWDSSNILKIIQDLQAKINTDNNTSEDANSNSLGLQFNSLSDDTILESLFFDELDDFHPLIVPGGCQIGKFAGGAKLAGMQVVLDKIGSETTLGILKSTNFVFEINALQIDSGLPEKEKLKLQFKNRLAKETVLAYMDITAFYGACENQGIRIRGVANNTSFLDKFHNNKSIYIDIRDERGFSYNHFYKLENTIKIGFYNGTDNDPVYSSINYYQDWPILKLENQSYNSSKEFFYIKLPLTIGMPENANIITSFTKKVSFGKNKRSLRYKLLNEQDSNGNVTLKESEPIRLKNWDYSDDTLGTNYFLLKLDRIALTDRSQILSPVWNSFFNIKMKHIFGLNNIQDGEFRVKTYASINAPLITNDGADEVFYPTIGIAADKYHITFFSFYREAAHKIFSRKNRKQPLKIVDTSKFNYSFDTNDLEYQNSDQAVGFLYQITNNHNVKDFELSQYSITDSENDLQDVKFLKYLKSGEIGETDDFFENFEAITLTHAEYNYLKTLETTTIADSDFISEHSLYIRSSNNKRFRYQTLSLLETTISLGVPKIVGDNTSNVFDVELSQYPNAIQLNNEDITLISVI